jgi:Domain of unknown function (DUF1707)/Domain of unknown function (DUF4190)
MTVGGYGSMRATDADRNNVHDVLQAAYADGRLTWEEFDARSTALLAAKTYNELAVLTTDLRGPGQVVGQITPYQPMTGYTPAPRTSPVAICSLAFGVGQMFIPLAGTAVAIACGHAARSQIKRTGEGGAGLATAGLVLGYLGLIFWLLVIVSSVASGQH